MVDIIPDRAGPLNVYRDGSEIREHDSEIQKHFEGKKNHNRNTLYTEDELKSRLVNAFEKSGETRGLYDQQRKLYGNEGGTGPGEVFDPVFRRARQKLESSNDINLR
ncbi:hypothetical protein ACXYTJ_02160 [Gilvimarinus sp. F26214L]|uniref:hypothetical protein n=1 Tax=Gilvimarinus sp. DZF01 TaxID=3461371 RepID=UPI0040453C0F